MGLLFEMVSFQYFEQDDPDLYLNKIKYILEHDVEEMDLYFVEEDYDQAGQLHKVSFILTISSLVKLKYPIYNVGIF
jgi:hypothetical protein